MINTVSQDDQLGVLLPPAYPQSHRPGPSHNNGFVSDGQCVVLSRKCNHTMPPHLPPFNYPACFTLLLLNGPFCFGPPHHLCWHPHSLSFCSVETICDLCISNSLRLFTLNLCVIFLAENSAMKLRSTHWRPELNPGQVQVDSWPAVKPSTPVIYWSKSFLHHVGLFNWFMCSVTSKAAVLVFIVWHGFYSSLICTILILI